MIKPAPFTSNSQVATHMVGDRTVEPVSSKMPSTKAMLPSAPAGEAVQHPACRSEKWKTVFAAASSSRSSTGALQLRINDQRFRSQPSMARSFANSFEV
jgi:hypothetical protein